MAAQIVLNQAAKPPGVAGRAREDLSTGTAVTASAVGGPFLAYQWNLLHRPINIMAATRATTAIATPTSSSTSLTPIDVAGTYLLELLVDSGSGLGAAPTDIARITFYAGPTLQAAPNRLPRRRIAFGETLEHNVLDALDPISGNAEGWSREWYRWFEAIQRLYDGSTWASGRVTLTAVSATLVRGFNLAAPTRVNVGEVDFTFTTALPDGNYAVIATARGATGGSCVVSAEVAAGFKVHRADGAGSLVDADFNLIVVLGV